MNLCKNQRGNSVIEIIVVIVIVTVGIVGAYGIINSGQRLSTTSENRIKAINIAREGLEAVENIRDTNWLKFSSDYDNCWKVKDYNVTCIGYTPPPNSNVLSGSNILVQSGVLWTLSGVSSPASIATAYTAYIDQFPVFLDSNGLTSSSGSLTMAKCTPSLTMNCRSMFSREIKVINPVDNDYMTVHSIVTWVDSGKTSGPYIIDLETTLTNWKKKF